MFRLAIFLLASFTATVTAQPPALRIVVIEGEDGVNIIQQKTAVRPIVEVRDRNNLPVTGALVTFSIPGGQAASFGGASTLTIATNAAGQAAAQAARASGGGTSTGTAGSTGGGGVSAATLGVIGAAVGGGVLAATQLAGKDETPAANSFSGAFSGQIVSTIVSQSTCTITRSVNGTVKLTLETQTATTFSGKAEITGTDVVIGSSCGGASGTANINYMFNVAGTPSNFGFQQQFTDTRPLDVDPRMSVNSTTNILLEAALSGGVITGTFKYQEQSTITGPNPTSRESSSGSFPFTLR